MEYLKAQRNEVCDSTNVNAGSEWMQYGPGLGRYFIGTASGDSLTIENVADSLSKINRFNGHNPGDPLSVAQHSVFVSEMLDFDPLVSMYALAHDAAESVIGDKIQPYRDFVKRVNPDAARFLRQIEEHAEQAVFPIFKLPYPMPEEIRRQVKCADMTALATEYRDLFKSPVNNWSSVEGIRPHWRTIAPMPWADARDLFLSRFEVLNCALTGNTGTKRSKGMKATGAITYALLHDTLGRKTQRKPLPQKKRPIEDLENDDDEC